MIDTAHVRDYYACARADRSPQNNVVVEAAQGNVDFDEWLTSLRRSAASEALYEAASTFDWAGDDEDYTAFRDWLRNRALDYATGRAAGTHAVRAALTQQNDHHTH